MQALVRAQAGLKDPVADFLRTIPGGKRTAFRILHESREDEDAPRIVEVWARMAREQGMFGDVGKIHLEFLLDELEMDSPHFIGIVYRCLVRFGILLAKTTWALTYPAMMKVSMARALDADATDERRIHFLASGHLPSSKGIQIGIQNVTRQGTVVDAVDDDGAVPRIEHTVRQVVRDLDE